MMFKNNLEKEIYYRSQIDYCYWRIQDISKHNAAPQSILDALIDKSTGFDKTLVFERIKEVKYLSGVIIRCKSRLGINAKSDSRFLYEIKKLEKEMKNNPLPHDT